MSEHICFIIVKQIKVKYNLIVTAPSQSVSEKVLFLSVSFLCNNYNAGQGAAALESVQT